MCHSAPLAAREKQGGSMGGELGKLNASQGDFSILKNEREKMKYQTQSVIIPVKNMLSKFVRSGERNWGGAVTER